MKIGRVSVAPAKARPVFNLPLEVAYEDDCMAVIQKPAGFHCKGIGIQKIDNALSSNLKPSTAVDRLPGGPVAVHRLDARTSGLLVIAKTRKAHMSLYKQFDRNIADGTKGKVQKKYTAIVMGKLEGSGICDSDIYSAEKEVEREAKTRWRALEHTRSGSFNWEWVTTVECEPLTGRTHQIRVHMQRLGHPICGDDLYESDRFVTLKGGGLFLHSTAVHLDHPLTGERLEIECEMPYKFSNFLRRQSARLKAKDRDAQQAALLAAQNAAAAGDGEPGQTCIEMLTSHYDPEGSKRHQEDLNPAHGTAEPAPKRQRGSDRVGPPPYLALPPSPARSSSPSPFQTGATVHEKGSLLNMGKEPPLPFRVELARDGVLVEPVPLPSFEEVPGTAAPLP